jgi:hypothetical protein
MRTEGCAGLGRGGPRARQARYQTNQQDPSTGERAARGIATGQTSGRAASTIGRAPPSPPTPCYSPPSADHTKSIHICDHGWRAGWPGSGLRLCLRAEYPYRARALARQRRGHDLTRGILLAAVCPGMMNTPTSGMWWDVSDAPSPADAGSRPAGGFRLINFQGVISVTYPGQKRPQTGRDSGLGSRAARERMTVLLATETVMEVGGSLQPCGVYYST